MTGKQRQQFCILVQKRSNHIPFAYIIGKKQFMGIDFEVNPSVLIPRPETEILVHWVLAKLDLAKDEKAIVDVGTGSGAIALSIAKLSDNVKVYAVEKFANSLNVAKQNVSKLSLESTVTLLQGELLEPLLLKKKASEFCGCKPSIYPQTRL